MNFGAQDEVVAFLASLEGARDIVTTHISVVVIGESCAYKLKRAVRFPYLDFSTPPKRFAMCEREVALNRRFAPSLYIGARRVTRTAHGALELDGGGALVDAVVMMRRFEQDALLDNIARAGGLTRAMIEALARRIAETHDAAPVDAERGGATGLRRVLDGAEESSREAAAAPPAEIEARFALLREVLDTQSARLDARRAQGKVRRCHGDLTLRNICLLDGEPTPFDCLEFDDDIATVDVLYDLAFLLMDLWRIGERGFANLALNRYLDAREEADGLPLLPLFMALRATIRAHVEASQSHADAARDYFALAGALLRPASPRIVAVGGFSGSGKSSVSAQVAHRLGAAPGARTLNSDRLRKAMFGVVPTARLPQEAYASEVSARVYARLFDEATRIAALGWSVVVDAVLDRVEDRARIEEIARAHGLRFDGFWLDAEDAQRVARVEARRGDVSDATKDIALAQARREPGPMQWTRIDASRTLETSVAEIARALET